MFIFNRIIMHFYSVNLFLQILDSVMRELYQLLKLTLKSENDEGVQRQIVLAHNELEDIMKEVLFPKQVLQKKIRIRDAEF